MHNHEVLFNLQLSRVSVNAHEKLFIDSKTLIFLKALKFFFYLSNGFNLMYTQIPIPCYTIATNYALINK